jgi:hypothetical protein
MITVSLVIWICSHVLNGMDLFWKTSHWDSLELYKRVAQLIYWKYWVFFCFI